MKQRQNVLYVILFVYLLCSMLTITSIGIENNILSTVLKYIRYITYLAFITNIIIEYRDITIKDLFILIIGLTIMLTSKNKIIFLLSIILVSCKKLDVDKILKYSYYFFGWLFIIIFILSTTKIIPDWTFLRGTLVRHAHGFIYPTDCYSVFLLFTLLFIYNNRKKILYREIILLFLTNISLFYSTNGRLSFLLINIVIILSLVFNSTKLKKKFNRKEWTIFMRTTAWFIPILFFLISIALVVMYAQNNWLAIKINHLLSDRLMYAADAVSSYPITLFGQKIEWQGWGGYGYVKLANDFKYSFVDNSYLKILFDYGIVGTGIILYGYTRLLLHCCDKKNKRLYIILTIVLIWSFVEPYIILLYRNIFVISFILLLKKERKKKKQRISWWVNEKINQKKLRI